VLRSHSLRYPSLAVEARKPACEVVPNSGCGMTITGLAFIPHPELGTTSHAGFLASTAKDGYLKLWDLSTHLGGGSEEASVRGRAQFRVRNEGQASDRRSMALESEQPNLGESVPQHYLPLGTPRIFAVAYQDGSIRLWSFDSAAPRDRGAAESKDQSLMDPSWYATAKIRGEVEVEEEGRGAGRREVIGDVIPVLCHMEICRSVCNRARQFAIPAEGGDS
jgi:WD40 repeat protein